MGAYLVRAWFYMRNRDKTINLALEDMRENPSNSLMQKEKCTALWKLVAAKRYKINPGRALLHQRKIGSRGGVELTLKVLRNHTNELALRAASLLLSEFADNIENAERIRKDGGIELMAKVFKENEDDEFIVEDLNTAQANMVTSGITLEKDNIRKGKEHSDLTIIISSMYNQPLNVEVQRMALDALWCLCREDEMRLKFLEADGVPVLIKALENHPKDDVVVSKALGTVLMLAKHESLKSIIGKSGSIAAIVQVFKLHQTNFKLLQQAIWALNQLSGNEKNKIRLKLANVGKILYYCSEDAKEAKEKIVVPLKLKRMVNEYLDEDDSSSGSSEYETDSSEEYDKAASKKSAIVGEPSVRGEAKFRYEHRNNK